MPTNDGAAKVSKKFVKCDVLGREAWVLCEVERMDSDSLAVVRLECRKVRVLRLSFICVILVGRIRLYTCMF